jgi:hypothetical protein
MHEQGDWGYEGDWGMNCRGSVQFGRIGQDGA